MANATEAGERRDELDQRRREDATPTRPSFDTSMMSLDETANHVAAWTRALLSGELAYGDGLAG